MKKIMMILALALSLAGSTAFAGETNGEVAVRQEVLKAFNASYADAKNVKWTAGENYFKASFELNGQYLFAYYAVDGQLMGLTRNISSLQLPLSLQSSLKKSYSDKWITELFEVSNEDGTTYYITLENADSKLVLKSVGNGWTVHRKISKA